MAANTFGQYFQFHSFGESHGTALGCVIDGCPAGVSFDIELLKRELSRRRPGQSTVVSARKETDNPEILSGVFEDKTLGTPIAVIVRNQDAQSSDYQEIKNNPRSGHADDVWKLKFGHRDYRGGGRSSGRETISRVIAGAVARMLIQKLNPNIQVLGFTTQIFDLEISDVEKANFLKNRKSSMYPADEFPARFPIRQKERVTELLETAVKNGESYGAKAEIRIFNLPPGLGQPVFHKLKSDLAMAIMSIGAVSSFQLGVGNPVEMRGTDFHQKEQADVYGGIRGGISTGEEVIIEIQFKPTSSILDVAKKGRHDPCIVTRALPVVEAMVNCVIADHLLLARLDQI